MADKVKNGIASEQWDLAVALFGRENLIPIASEGEVSPNSSLDPKSVGKIPSVHNSRGKIVGFKDWTAYKAKRIFSDGKKEAMVLALYLAGIAAMAMASTLWTSIPQSMRIRIPFMKNCSAG